MRRYLIFLFLSVGFSVCIGMKKAIPVLYPVLENGRYGFIDITGKMIIPCRYRSAGKFSNGLAAVRENGLYGYINTKGEYVIPPQFDYAEDFQNQLGLVYKNGKAYFVDAEGKISNYFPTLDKTKFPDIFPWQKDKHGHFGYLNKYDHLIIDTSYDQADYFTNGIALVSQRDSCTENNSIKYNHKYALIDTTGKYVVPFGKYQHIHKTNSGFYRIIQTENSCSGKHKLMGLLDSNGHELFLRKYPEPYFFSDDISEGKIKIILYKMQYYNERVTSSAYMYPGYANMKGDILLNDTTLNDAGNFSEGRTFVSHRDKQGFGMPYILLNEKMERVGKNEFGDYDRAGFKNGRCIAGNQGHQGVINRDGEWVVLPKWEAVKKVPLMEGYYFVSGNNKDGKRLWGMIDIKGKHQMPLLMESVSTEGFYEGLLFCVINGKYAWVNADGKIIWQAKTSTEYTEPVLNIDYMAIANYVAGSIPYKTDLGGFGKSENYPVKIPLNQKKRNGKVWLWVDTLQASGHQTSNRNLSVLLANEADSAALFSGMDSRLNISMQAQDAAGNWKDIEYRQASWCGNSYHTLVLKSGYAWKLSAPQYDGAIKTQLRLKLEMRNGILVYSNTFTGHINPAQFWRRQSYTSGGLMDPYGGFSED